MAQSYLSVHELRGKLARWRVSMPPVGVLLRRAPLQLFLAFRLVPPRVASVLLRMWRDGWCTAKRFQNRMCSCVFRSPTANAEDSILHYAFCPLMVSFANRMLELPRPETGCMKSSLLLGNDDSEDVIALQLLRLYAIYSASNCCRYRRRSDEDLEMDIPEMQLQHA